MCKKRFETEYEAYRRLSSLQGVTIPRCYGAVIVSPPDIPLRDIAETLVYGIIVENIDAAPLPSVDLSSHEFSSLGHSLMATVYSLSSHGVIHNDIRSGNILISPNQTVLIDFGQAILRGNTEEDEHWTERVREEEEVEGLRRILHHREIRDCTPYIPTKGYRGFFHFNRNVSRQRESWRKRWYAQVGTIPENDEDKDGPEQPAYWTLKKEVQAWLNSRPESFKVPRPGSPNYIEQTKGLTSEKSVKTTHLSRVLPDFAHGVLVRVTH
jgi:serine/threonine protein kinase